MAKKIVPIKYTSRDFQTIKDDLVEHAKRYYPNTYKDFSEASFGSLMMDTVAYVGDILSFYLDYQANESFLDTAAEFDNVIKIGNQFGYKHSSANSSTGIASFYISVPANATALGPNATYLPVLKKGSVFSTRNNTRFILNDDVRFDNPNNEIRILRTEPTTGRPLYYAVKALGPVISGVIDSETITIGAYEKFRKVTLSQLDIVEILSVTDSEGHEYYEVDFLSQNIIYRSVTNKNANDSVLAKEVLKPFMVPRRFVIQKSLRETILQFGASSEAYINDTNTMLTEPSKVVLNMHGKDYISSTYFDPTRLATSDKFGISPSNTTLTITYRYNISNSFNNFSVNSLTDVVAANLQFKNESSLDSELVSIVKNSIEINNEAPILGDNTEVDSEDLKVRIKNTFATQNRAVTKSDYTSLIYSMPSKYGSIKRVNIVRDDNSLKRNLNIYVVCSGEDGFLTAPNISVKNNIKTWISKSKMINDSIDILDGIIVNYGITFQAVGRADRAKYDILNDAIAQLKRDFSLLPEIGETFSISNVYDSLKKVDGILDVTRVVIEEKVGGVYSDASFSFKENTSADNRYIKVPLNVILELKYPNDDIKGTII
jgi:hypothetical protein